MAGSRVLFGCLAAQILPHLCARHLYSYTFLSGDRALASLLWTQGTRRRGPQRLLSLRTLASGASGGKSKLAWRCSDCGEEFPQWTGRCRNCSAYNSLQKVTVVQDPPAGGGGGGGVAAARAAAAQQRAMDAGYDMEGYNEGPGPGPVSSSSMLARGSWVVSVERPQSVLQLSRRDRSTDWRVRLEGPSGQELNRVLGGGIFPGSLVLLGGDPGVGKSTLLLQMAGMLTKPSAAASGSTAGELVADPPSDDAHSAGDSVSKTHAPDGAVNPRQRKVLYVSGEESVEQVGARAERMGLAAHDGLYIFSATRLADVLREVVAMRPACVVVDSIQTVYLDDIPSSAGSIVQVRECSTALLRVAKELRIPIFMIGHVTKTGEIAGPRVLEHIVDVVLYMEGERHQSYRLVRAIKNRHGRADEVGVFQMEEHGLAVVSNPSQLFLSAREHAPGLGCGVTVTVEGTRPILAEVQALCTRRPPQGTQDVPLVRSANGVPRARLGMLLAVLAKHTEMRVHQTDIYTNVVGGLQLSETATDLAIAVAVASSFYDRPLPRNLALVGEIGLGGELRTVGHLEKRLAEAAKLGFTRCIVPAAMESSLKSERLAGVQVHQCQNVQEALAAAFGWQPNSSEKRRGGRYLESDGYESSDD